MKYPDEPGEINKNPTIADMETWCCGTLKAAAATLFTPVCLNWIRRFKDGHNSYTQTVLKNHNINATAQLSVNLSVSARNHSLIHSHAFFFFPFPRENKQFSAY